MITKLLLIPTILFLSGLSIPLPAVAAEDFPFSDSAEEEFKKGFGETEGITESEKGSSEDDRFKIGGALLSEFYALKLGSENEASRFANPNNLWLYGDAELRNDIRAYIRSRLIFEPTNIAGTQYASSLDELKLFFNAKKTVFFTLGKQKIKWGSSRFWNPTDFINTMQRNFLRPEDERSGVTLVKSHLPLGKSNYYLIQTLDDANRISQIGNAARAELVFGNSEIALSGAVRKDHKSAFGLDISSALWDFDGTFEFAYRNSRARWTGGLSYEAKVSDQDTITLAAEYFYNGEGYGSTTDYAFAIQNFGYAPFYLSKHYGMFMVYLPAPGSWNDVSFSLFNIVNLTDGSVLSRLQADVVLQQDLTCVFNTSAHYGNPQGEFRLANQTVDAMASVRVDF